MWLSNYELRIIVIVVVVVVVVVKPEGFLELPMYSKAVVQKEKNKGVLSETKYNKLKKDLEKTKQKFEKFEKKIEQIESALEKAKPDEDENENENGCVIM